MLNEVLFKGIPADIVTSQASSDELDELLKFLRIKIECREKTFLFNNWSNTSESYVLVYNRSPKKQTPTPAAWALLNSTNSSRPSGFFCSATQHKTEDCRSDMALEEKRKPLASGGRCCRCMAKVI